MTNQLSKLRGTCFFLVLFLSSLPSFAQNLILPANNRDIVLPVGVKRLYDHTMNCDMSSDGTDFLVAVVIDDQDLSGQLYQIELVLYNGLVATNTIITPANISMASGYSSFNYMYNPDVVLVDGGTKVIITFDTDNSSFGAYWLEYDIDPSTLVPTQNTGLFGGAVPIGYLYSGGSSYCHSPRIDRSPNGSTDMVTTVALQELDGSPVEIPVINYFENLSGFYEISPNQGLQYQPVVDPGSSFPYYNPDIAVGWDEINNEFCCVVTSVQSTLPNEFTVYEHEFRPSVPGIYTNNYSNNVSMMVPFTSNGMNIRPRICAPYSYNTSPTFQVPYALCYSSAEMNPMYTMNTLYYCNSDMTGTYVINPNAISNIGPSYCGEPCIEYMMDTVVTGTEAAVVWPSIIGWGTVNEAYGVYALMDPIMNNACYDWEQVNKTPILNDNNVHRSTAIAGSWDNAFDNYIVAWLRDDGTDNILCLKLRPMHTTGYKAGDVVNNVAYSVFPNPAKNYVRINIPEAKNYQVLNALGTVVAEGVGESSSRTEINTSTFASGSYFILIDGQSVPFSIAK